MPELADQRPADHGADQEAEQGEQRGAERKARRAGDREAGEHDVARHVGHEDPPQLQNAHRIYQAGHHRERQQEWRQRTVTRIASGQLPYPGPGVLSTFTNANDEDRTALRR